MWSPSETSPDGETRSSNASSLWLQGFGDSGHVDGDGNAATVTRSLGGLILGVDGHVDDRYRFGVAGGYTKSWLSIDARNSSGTAESVFGGIYGSAGFGALQLRAGVLYSRNDYDTTRRIDFPGFQDTERASYAGNTLQAFGEAGWLFSLPGATIEPFAGGMAMSIDTDRFAETGGTAGLQGRSRSDSYQATTLGVRLASEPLAGFSVTGSVGWQRVFGDLKPRSVLAFNGASTPFAITGAPVARDNLVIEAGLDWRITDRVSAGVSYSGALANKSYSNAIQGRIRIGL
jgi:outer membrane autotransporter protein